MPVQTVLIAKLTYLKHPGFINTWVMVTDQGEEITFQIEEATDSGNFIGICYSNAPNSEAKRGMFHLSAYERDYQGPVCLLQVFSD